MSTPTTKQRVKIVQQRYRDKATGETRLSSTYYLQYSLGGRQVRRPTGTTDPGKAERERKKLEAKLTLGQEPESPKALRTSFEELATLLLNHYDNNGLKSKDRVEYALENLKVPFAGQKALHITADRVAAYTAARKKAGAANATINQELACLRRMFSLGERDGLVAKAPRIDLLRVSNARKGFFERDQYLSIRAALPAPIQPLVDVTYVTGWRVRSEFLPLTWAQVDFQHGWLRLEPGTTKNREGRAFPLTPELRTILEAQRAATEEAQKKTKTLVPWVFWRCVRSKGRLVVRPITSFMRAWRAACLAAGFAQLVSERPRKIGKLTRVPHDFRRTAVRNLERAGVSRSAAMKMVGHKTESIYRRYAVVSEGDLKVAGQQLAALHGQDATPRAKVVPLAR